MSFLPADNAAAATPKTNGATHRESLLPSPSPEAVTPQRGSTDQPVGSVSRPESRPADSKNLGEIRESAHNPASSSVATTVSAAAAGVARAIPTSSEELQAQLSEAKATIVNLRKQMEASTGLRQRKTEPTRDSKEQMQTAVSTQQAPTGGVSVPITAFLCLLSFLIAYFLF